MLHVVCFSDTVNVFTSLMFLISTFMEVNENIVSVTRIFFFFCSGSVIVIAMVDQYIMTLL